jgi:hypothetical protein
MQQGTSREENMLRAVSGVLGAIEHATIATVSAQGRPWNTPVYFARHGAMLYWISRVDAQHPSNVRNDPHAFAVIYDSRREDSTGAALYIDAHVSELTDQAAIEFPATLIYRRRGKPVSSSIGSTNPLPTAFISQGRCVHGRTSCTCPIRFHGMNELRSI